MRRSIMITSFAAPGARRGALRILSAAALVAMVVPLEQMPVQAAGAPSAVQGPPPIEFDPQGVGNVFPPAAACNNQSFPSTFFGVGCGTTALAINDPGEVVGTYTDASLVQHGFLRARNGDITTIDYSEAGVQVQGTVAYSINNAGVIAGAFLDSNTVFHGFLRYPWGYFEPLDAPGAGKGAGQGTFALSVNLPGTTTTGVYVGADNVVHGFVLTPANTIESFDATKYTSFTFPCEETCVNPVGAITGYFLDSTNTQHGFVRSPSGNITTFDAPNAVTYTFAASINPRGVIAGYFGDQNGVPHGYVLFPNGSFSPPIDYPAAVGTAVLSINPSGKTTGEYFDANLVGHGFERDAQGHFINFSAEDAGTGQFQGTRPSTNNSSGEVTGWYISSDVNGNNVNHGFVWEPSAATQ